jgi:hypothetical protein
MLPLILILKLGVSIKHQVPVSDAMLMKQCPVVNLTVQHIELHIIIHIPNKANAIQFLLVLPGYLSLLFAVPLTRDPSAKLYTKKCKGSEKTKEMSGSIYIT